MDNYDFALRIARERPTATQLVALSPSAFQEWLEDIDYYWLRSRSPDYIKNAYGQRQETYIVSTLLFVLCYNDFYVVKTVVLDWDPQLKEAAYVIYEECK